MSQLGIAWSTWKLATKRFGPVGGIVAALLVVVAYRSLARYRRH